jgi:hypothetical protein
MAPQKKGQTSSPEIWSAAAKLSCFLGGCACRTMQEAAFGASIAKLHPLASELLYLKAVGIVSRVECGASGRGRFDSKMQYSIRDKMHPPQVQAGVSGFYFREGANLGGL